MDREEKSNRVYPVEMAESLDNKLRKVVQNPRTILKSYIRPGMMILDIVLLRNGMFFENYLIEHN